MRAIVAFCEGVDDQAFLYRILGNMGFSHYSVAVNNLPFPFNKIFESEFGRFDLDKQNLNELRLIIPIMMKNDEDLFFVLYDVGGNTQFHRVSRLLNSYKKAMSSKLVPKHSLKKLGFLVVTDADNKGIKKKSQDLQNEYKDIFECASELEHKKLCMEDKHLTGTYIIADETGMGRLEGIILPLLTNHHSGLFEEVTGFIKKHEHYYTKESVKYLDKMAIGIAGQLQKPGKTNQVIIRQAKLLTNEMLQGDKLCCEITDFLNSFIKEFTD